MSVWEREKGKESRDNQVNTQSSITEKQQHKTETRGHDREC